MSQVSKKWLRYTLTISLAATPLIGTESFADSCQDKQDEIVNACTQAYTTVAAQQQVTMSQDLSAHKSSFDNSRNAYYTAAAQGHQVADKCAQLADDCEQVCKTAAEKKSCREAVNQKANDIKAQSVANTQNGGNSGMISSLMGAAMGAAMGYMMAKQQQQNQPPPPPPQPIATGALQLNGSLNCQMQDSYRYEDCNSFLTQYCQAQSTTQASTTVSATPMTGTVISQAAAGVLPSTPDCASFTASYCATSVTPPVPYGNVRQDGSITQVNMAGTGEGLGTPYCGNAVASQWCSDPLYGSARASCPACRQMQTNNSATCAANPALCLAQNSPQQLAAVTVGSVCSGDPLYTPGSPYALPGVTGTAATVVAGQAAVTGGGLPVVVLPSSTAPVGSGVGMPVGPPVTGGGIAVTSATKGGVREGRAVASAGGTAMQPSSVHAGTSELIAAGGVIVAGGPSGISRGPASDVEAKFGPSLFATTSNVVRQHCQAGKLNNCP